MLLASASIGFAIEMGPTMESYMVYGSLVNWIILSGLLFFFLNRIFDRDLKLTALALAALMLLTVLAVRLGAPVTDLGYSGWFFWCALIVLFIKVDHPPVLYHEPLTRGRRWLGILSFVIFALCFSVRPIYVG
jgi:nitrate reductase gamma subunit